MENKVPSQKSVEFTKMAIAFQKNPKSSFEKLGKQIFDVIQQALISKDPALFHSLYFNDLVQDSMEKVYLALLNNKFNDEFGAFTTYIYTIVRNVHINTHRKKKNPLDYANNGGTDDDGNILDIVDMLSDDSEKTPEALFIRKEKTSYQNKVLKTCLCTMPLRYQSVIEKRYFEDLSYEETALHLEIPLGSVKAQLHRGKKILHKKLNRNKKLKNTLIK